MNEQILALQYKMKKVLNKDRYQHTIGVMYTAASLAMCHNENIENALLAGLLHDCAKCISNTKKVKLCKKYKIPMNSVEQKNPGLLHAKLGAFLASHKYNISNKEIISAIASHTTGKPEMSKLDKIIYIADYMEPGRKDLPNMKTVRKLAYENLDLCLYRILEDSLSYFSTLNCSVDPMTEKTYVYYKQRMKAEEEC